MQSKDITLLIAHPDDEAIFLWPFLDRVKRIVCASNDAFNPDRKWCAERGWCLAEVGKLLGCGIVCHSNSSEFYRTETRNGSLHLLCSDLLKAVEDAEILATHNAYGEYGHIDHLLCHQIGRTHQHKHGGELLVTDIAVTERPAWTPVLAWDQIQKADCEGPTEHEIDIKLFQRIKAIYDARGCWTWSFPVQAKCSVFSI